jgi:hypothetical protein
MIFMDNSVLLVFSLMFALLVCVTDGTGIYFFSGKGDVGST